MKKSNKLSLSISAFVLLLAGFIFGASNIAFADEKKAEEAATTEAVADSDKAKDGEAKKDGDKKKKKGKDGEEPECE
jgi:hypothetical protein